MLKRGEVKCQVMIKLAGWLAGANKRYLYTPRYQPQLVQVGTQSPPVHARGFRFICLWSKYALFLTASPPLPRLCIGHKRQTMAIKAMHVQVRLFPCMMIDHNRCILMNYQFEPKQADSIQDEYR